MVFGWAFLSPIAKNSGWAPGDVNDMVKGARGWILWVALAIMCVDSLVSLAPVIWELVEKYILDRKLGDDDDEEHESEDRLVPMKWVIAGLFASIILGTVLVWIVFGHDGIKPWATMIGFLIGMLLSVLGYVTKAFSL
jgi:F0F1-type ATP synthase assembly protein I